MRKLKCVNVLTGIVLLGGTGVAFAAEAPVGSAKDTPWPMELNFDLSRDCPPEDSRSLLVLLPGDAEPLQTENASVPPDGMIVREELGPSWTFQRGSSGPVLQFAALGAGKKERPGLAHLALDWNF